MKKRKHKLHRSRICIAIQIALCHQYQTSGGGSFQNMNADFPWFLDSVASQ